ncbi:MAG TPA: radical SAM protein [bacterium]|nr:radical SAM protein [bacterium]
MEFSKKPDVLDEKTRVKEAASSEKHAWVRLTHVCNNNCVFCLDKSNQDGTVLPFDELVEEFRRGREDGATRLILSGGEATMHPRFIDLVREGSRLGFRRVQVVSNGRMFAYRKFLEQAIKAGLGEITFSMHGHTPELHDAQTRIKGSFVQALAGIINALDSGKLIVNVDIVINRFNYKVIDKIMDFFIGVGIREFDLLHVTPFGEAWTNRRKVMYDPAEGIKYINKAFEYSRRPDLFVWTNRFPPKYLSAFPELIQNPLKIKDEVRGRMNMYTPYLEEGVPLRCRDERCKYCFMEGLCDELMKVERQLKEGVTSLRVSAASIEDAFDVLDTRELKRLCVHSDDIPAGELEFPSLKSIKEIELELNNYDGLDELAGAVPGIDIIARTAEIEEFEKIRKSRSNVMSMLELNVSTQEFIRENRAELKKGKTRIFVTNREDLAESSARDVVLREFFDEESLRVLPTENVPGCVVDAPARKRPWFLDFGSLNADGSINMQMLAHEYIMNRYYVFQAECGGCTKKRYCPGVHVNYFRAHGFEAVPFRKNKLK